jgi:fibronectin type 3 domain-containing protein
MTRNLYRFMRGPRSARPRRATQTRRVVLNLEPLESRLAPSVNAFTYRYDSTGTGANLGETQLNPQNVQPGIFGKLFSTPVDGQVYAQPLYVSSLNVTVGPSPGVHNVVFVATEHNSVYAIDGDNGTILWQDSFLNPSQGVTTVPNADVNSNDLTPEIGITATPVIDPSSGTLYVEAKTKEVLSDGTHYVQRLHALDITNGNEKLGGPVVIADTIYDGTNYTYVSGPSVAGSGDGSVNGVITFNALRQMVRPALALANGNVYLASASHGDNFPYHGWVLSYNAATLQLDGVLNTTPNGGQGGIWESGGSIAVDGQGNLYVMTGNGTFDTTLDANGFPINGDYGDSFLKIAVDPTTSPTNPNINGWGLKVVDYFTPFNQAGLNTNDGDLGAGGPLLLPDSAGTPSHPHLLIGVGKLGLVYVLDRDNMGHFDPNTDHVVEEVPQQLNFSYATPAYFNNQIYIVGANGDYAKSFTLSNGLLSLTPASESSDFYRYPGSTPTVSANGTTNGIVWDLDRTTAQLRAYDATGYGHELYTTNNQASNGQDRLDSVAKFAVPMVINGHVYVGTNTAVTAYGLLAPPTAAPAAPSNLTANAVSSSEIDLTWIDNSSYPNPDSGSYVEVSTDGVNFTQIGQTSAGATGFAATGLQPSTLYTFRVRTFNSVGTSAYSNLAQMATPSGVSPGGLDFSNGFANSASQLTFNGASATVQGTALQLTDGGTNEAASVFSTNRVDVTKFAAHFTFQIADNTTPGGEGFTFTIQGVGPNALGGAAESLGYGSPTGQGGIGNSMAIKFDLYSDQGEGPDSTGMYSGGMDPTLDKSIDLTPAGINFHSGHVFDVGLSYDGTTLTVVLSDTSTEATANQAYPVNIPALVGGGTAYVGFTASTGAVTAAQQILTWFYSPTPVPAAPTNLQAAPVTGTSVQLTWVDNATNATGYEIDRAADGLFTQSVVVQTAPANATSFQDVGLNTGTTYYYRVRALGAFSDSAYSNTAFLTTPTVPTPPSGARVSRVTSTEVDLTWNNTATNAQGIQIFRQLGSNSFNLIATLPATSTSYNDTGLNPGTSYNYNIQAYNLAGYSAVTSVSTATLTVAPTNVTATAGNGQITLSWTAPAGAGTFNIYKAISSGGEGNKIVKSGVTGIAFTDTGLTNGTTYYYQVTAVDAGGESARSAEVNATPQHSAIAPVPTGVTATPGNGQVALSWNASPTATSYNVYRSTSSGGEGATPYQTGVTSTSFTDTGLTNGTTYYYQITAVNAAGESPKSSEVSATPLSGPPAPTNLTATPGNGQVALSWTASSGAATYNIYRSTSSGGEGATPYLTGVTATSLTDSGLTNGTTYYYQVTAVDGIGHEGPRSSEVSATPQAATTPPAPTNLAATAGNGQVALTWNASAGAATYNIYRGTSKGGEGSVPYRTGITGTAFTDTGVTSGTRYFYVVTAVNAAGESAKSNEVGATPLAGLAAPGNVTATAHNAQVTLSWTAPAGAVSYNIYRATRKGGEGTIPYQTGVTSTSFTDTGLSNGTTYFYIVTAVDGSGTEGARSIEVSATPQAGLSTVTNLTTTAGPGQSALTRNASAGAATYNNQGTSKNGEGSVPYETDGTGTLHRYGRDHWHHLLPRGLRGGRHRRR